MKINLNIERLVLEGFSLTHRERSVLQETVESELGRLLAGAGTLRESRSTATPVIQAPGFQLEKRTGNTDLGRQIAQSIYGGITRNGI